MISAREKVYQALFQLLKAIPGFNSASRRYVSPASVPMPNQPALFVVQIGERAEMRGRGIPIKWTLSVRAVIYANTADTETDPPAVINPLVDAVEAALEPDPASGRQTLGGLVYDCRINGNEGIDMGFVGAQGIAVIPIEITTTS